MKDMTLKEECVDMLQLIFKPLQKKDASKEYTIEIDEYLGYCLYFGEDEYMMSCNMCEGKDGQGDQCNHKIYINRCDADMFWSTGRFRIFVFGKQSEHKQLKNRIWYINNRNQLLEAMASVKLQAEYFRDGYADYTKRVEQYKKHSMEFYDKLVKDFPVFSKVEYDTDCVLQWI